ncbi:MAG: hypothetical protein JWN25_901 [Verrucomicrobiales bacterium]|nr:hypothetical protein [Verrucomicrobiales bacterium]
MKHFFLTAFLISLFLTSHGAETEDEVEGMGLAKEVRTSRPETNSVMTGTLNIKMGKTRKEIPMIVRVTVQGEKWLSEYETRPGAELQEKLTVKHSPEGANEYFYSKDPAHFENPAKVGVQEVFIPFAGSDFALGELGLEFLHWPVQRRLKGEMRLGRPCYVLESVDPKGSITARVICYIDKETKGILMADVFNAEKVKTKEFSLSGSSFKKVNGQWQLEEMKMRNLKTNSQTTLKLDLGEN